MLAAWHLGEPQVAHVLLFACLFACFGSDIAPCKAVGLGMAAWPKNHINFTADALPVAQAPEETSQKLIRLKLLKPTAGWFQLS